MQVREKRLQINDIYVSFLLNTLKILLFYGGAGSGKSHFVAQKIILRCLSEPNSKFLVLRKVGGTLKESVFALFKEVIYSMDIQEDWVFNKSSYELFHKKGAVIICKGLDEPEKIKSITGITSVWMEELTEFTYDDWTQVLLRVRGELPPGVKYVQFIGTFNPISEYHWIKRKIIDTVGENPDIGYLHTTYKENHYLTDDYKNHLESLKATNPIYYQVYCQGEWGVEDKTGKFAYSFDKEKHVKKGVDWDKEEYTYLSFDFNVNPICCSVIQNINNSIRVVQTIKLKDSNIYSLCDYIKAKYYGGMFIVTGDATGRARSALVEDNVNYYTVIKSKLGLLDSQLQVPSVNPKIIENKVLVNAVLLNVDVQIDEDEAEGLVFDLTYCEVTADNKLKKDNRSDEKQQADALDTFRYYLNMFWKHILQTN